ncbi:HprK-related kinase A [Massilia sp. BJB1822]|uniref:HprK-related kinase A n=1 Tax=Massilia sp. BJB1822 TaxID=2744470 RepID=UPI0015936380|nr:HprK-related kinase A [Massilia sp. BJB1822]NVD96932.1 HprK-related kinase A [Massilia sp. BJB1822]
MLNVGSLARAELAAQLAGAGIRLRTGAFTTCLHSAIPSLAEGIALLYADYPLLTKDDFADFHLQLVRPLNARRWIKPQVKLLYDRRSIFKPLPLDQAFPMFEWGLNWCVSSRANRYLIVHAAVVEKGGRALILPAPPGSGKSTLCAALVGRGGWRLLSDELTLLRLDDGLLHPLPRPVSLKNASIDIIARYVPQAVMSRPVTDTVKGTVAHMRAPAASIARSGETAQPAWVIFPRYEAGAATALEPLAPAHAFMQLAQNCFNYSLLGAHGFTALGGLVERSLSYNFHYSVLDEALDAFDRLPPPPL